MLGKYVFSTLNCKGLRQDNKRRCIFQFLKTKKSDFFLLQETHHDNNDIHLWEQEWSVGVICSNAGTTASAGQLLLSSRPVRVLENTIHEEGRLHDVVIEDHDYVLRIINIYGYNAESLRVPLLKKLEKTLLIDKQCDFTCIGGDFNIVLSNLMDKEGGNCRKVASQVYLNTLLNKFNLVDVWRCENPTQKCFTWSQKNPLVQCRLDYFLVRDEDKKFVSKTKIVSSIRTDHKMVDMLVEIEKYKRGPGLWKLNNEVLKDENYVTKIKHLINSTWSHPDNPDNTDKAALYDFMKYEIRKCTKRYCKTRSKNRKLVEKELLNEIDHLEHKQQTQKATDVETNRLDTLKQELDLILESKAHGNWVRSRIKYIELNEKSTAFFHSMSKELHEKRTILSINTTNGTITNPEEILKEIKNFYKGLYTTQFTQDNTYERHRPNLDHIGLNKLSEQEKQLLEGPITLEELTKALKSFENNKTPGCDGLTKEFYMTFWHDLAPVLLETLNYCTQRHLMTNSQRRGVITLIHKDKDRTNIANYRPISLLNIDYKLLSKVLATRIKGVINKIVHSDQIGFLEDRFIGEGIRKVQDIIQQIERNEEEGYVLQLDFQKAFDSIEWDFMFDTLKQFNFGKNITDMIALCYTKIESCVLNSGYTTSWFRLQKGVRQGCPLSAYLFLLCIEILAQKIRNNNQILGIVSGQTEQKLSLFADDCTCLLKDIRSVKKTLQEINHFGLYSGLKLNTQKSVLYPISNTHQLENNNLNLTIKTDTISLLGITLGRDENEKYQLNVSEKCINMRKNLNRWSQRQLSLVGKILVTKSYAISKVIHTMTSTVVKEEDIKLIQQAVNKFIWSNKPAKVKHDVLINPLKEGGLNAMDIESQYKALKLPWVWRLMRSNNWNSAINDRFKQYGGIKLLINCNFDSKTVANVPQFYKEVLKYWAEIAIPPNCAKFVVWNNKNIKIGKQTVYCEELFRQNVVFVHDFTKNGIFLSYNEFRETYNVKMPQI